MNLSKNEAWAVFGISLSALLIILLTKSKTLIESVIMKVWDSVSEKRIETLHPAIQDQARIAINELDQQFGIKVRVTRARSTFEEQEKLYAQGRYHPGTIVTNADAGQSYHNYGLALDVVEMINGEPQWNSSNWDTIAAVFKKYGFEWGGDFRKFKDKPHFQKTFSYAWQTLYARHLAGDYDANNNINLA